MFLPTVPGKCSLKKAGGQHLAILKGKSLGNAQRLLVATEYVIPQVFLKTSGNAPKLTPAGQMLLLAGCDEKSGRLGHQPIGDKTELPSGYWQKRGKIYPFSLKHCISVLFYRKSKSSGKSNYQRSRHIQQDYHQPVSITCYRLFETLT